MNAALTDGAYDNEHERRWATYVTRAKNIDQPRALPERISLYLIRLLYARFSEYSGVRRLTGDPFLNIPAGVILLPQGAVCIARLPKCRCRSWYSG